MSTTIESIFGSKWQVGKGLNERGSSTVALDSRHDGGNRVFMVSDVLDAMKAEGVLDAVEIITELPEVEGDTGRAVRAGGEAYITNGEWADGSKHREKALERLAVARYLEAKNSEAIKAREEALRLHRRSIVSRHAAGLGAHDYESLDVNGKHLVDTIRELEDKLAGN